MAIDILEQTKQYKTFSDEELQDERLILMHDRAIIESDLEDKDRVEKEHEWAQRARFAHKIKGIYINALDYEINRRKKVEKNKPTTSIADCFMIEALGELDTETYGYIKERAETVYKEMLEVREYEFTTTLNSTT